MVNLRRSLVGSVCLLGLLGVSCAARAPIAVGASTSGTSGPAGRTRPFMPSDSVEGVIALSEEYFEAGRQQLTAGRLDAARTAFDRALEVLLERPGGARADDRLRDHFDRLVDRISSYEMTALAQGDGFTEKTSDPASIDELLAVSIFDQPEATTLTAETVAADLLAVPRDIDVPFNKQVLASVEMYTGRFKRTLENGLGRGAQYLPMIQQVFREEGLPLDLAYVPLVESSFRPLALSRAHARGIWQFMQATALENGLHYDWYVDERADPEKATRAAAKYLKSLHELFGDWHLALAAYNGGPGRVQRAMKSSGHDDFWTLSASSRYLPRETRDYVPLVLAAIVVARDPARYGVDVPSLAQPGHETIRLEQAVDLRRVAEWAEVPVEDVQELNPELRRWTTPIGRTDYELRVPPGSAARLMTKLAALGPGDLLPVSHYIVKKGDTLSGLATRLKVSRGDLADANYLSREARLQIGQTLIVPIQPPLLTARSSAAAPSPPEPSNVRAASPLTVAFTSPEPGEGQSVHSVSRGETLFSIARRYRTTVALLKQWNGLGSNLIRIGQQLMILPRSITHE